MALGAYCSKLSTCIRGRASLKKYGAKFIGRKPPLSVATTLPEIAIVIYAGAGGFYGWSRGGGLGSNLLMTTLGLSIMLLIATTRLSKAPLKGVNVATFKLDKIFLLATTVIKCSSVHRRLQLYRRVYLCPLCLEPTL